MKYTSLIIVALGIAMATLVNHGNYLKSIHLARLKLIKASQASNWPKALQLNP